MLWHELSNMKNVKLQCAKREMKKNESENSFGTAQWWKKKTFTGNPFTRSTIELKKWTKWKDQSNKAKIETCSRHYEYGSALGSQNFKHIFWHSFHFGIAASQNLSKPLFDYMLQQGFQSVTILNQSIKCSVFLFLEFLEFARNIRYLSLFHSAIFIL